VIAPALRYQLTIKVVEIEEPFQLRPSGLLDEPSIGPSLLIAQKLHRHAADRSR